MDQQPYETSEAFVQPSSVEAANLAKRPWILVAAYDRPIRFAVSQQLIFGILAALTLDFGVLAKRMAVSIVAFWLCFLIIAFRRPDTPTSVDLALVKWGFCILAVLTVCVR